MNDQPEMAILAAEVQPSSSYIAHARTETRLNPAIFSSDIEPTHSDIAEHSYVSPSNIVDVAPSSIVYRPSTAGQRQAKSSVPIGIDERGKSQSGMAEFESTGVKSRRVAEPSPRRLRPDIRCPRVSCAHRRCMLGLRLRRHPRLCLLA